VRRRRRLTILGGLLVVGTLLGACAAVPKHRYIQREGRGPIEVMAETGPSKVEGAVSLAGVEAAVRDAYRTRKPRQPIETIEGRDRELRSALEELSRRPDAVAHLRVGWAYRQAGVADRALDHFDAALRLDSRLAAAYDGRARTWRDWGLPASGLGDAARAVYHAPRSAAAHNTYGTLLLAMAMCGEARQSFSRAAALDSDATYPRDNLALVETLQTQTPGRCRDVSN
jgi:tetratricopeptide (TPR) repeat protein